jgi:hypothetical protein
LFGTIEELIGRTQGLMPTSQVAAYAASEI